MVYEIIPIYLGSFSSLTLSNQGLFFIAHLGRNSTIIPKAPSLAEAKTISIDDQVVFCVLIGFSDNLKHPDT